MFASLAGATLAVALLYRKQYIPFGVVVVLIFVYNWVFRRGGPAAAAGR
jgi:hypothetical protein